MIRPALRLALGGIQQLRRAFWFLSRPEIYGAHAAPITPAGRVVLVKLRYAPGWRVPGGGRKKTEDPREAVLRELREEIGLTAYGEVTSVGELLEMCDFRRDHASLFIVRNVQYRPPRWSLEIEEVIEAELDRLPPDTSPRTLRWLAAIRPML